MTARRPPLFVRIGLAWWLVLVAYPPTREFALFGDFLGSGRETETLTPGVRIAFALAYSLGAGWIVSASLRRWQAGPVAWLAIAWGVGIAWFAVSSWFLAWNVLVFATGRPMSMTHVFTFVLPFAFLFLPKAAFTEAALLPASWILVPLGIATALYVRRVSVRDCAIGRPTGVGGV